MRCLGCDEDLLYIPLNHGDLTVCGQCGEILVVTSLVPLLFQKAKVDDMRELHLCEFGRTLLMYSDEKKAARKGLTTSSDLTN